MHFKSRVRLVVSFALFTFCLPAQLQADTINFFEHLSPQHKAKFIIASMACLVGAVVGCAINLETNAPASNNNQMYPQLPAQNQAANSSNSIITLPNTVPKVLGTLLCGVTAIAGCYFANEASYGR
jgi:hypothetical protein